jgi:hypothetical protein
MNAQSKKMAILATAVLMVFLIGCSGSNKKLFDSSEFKEASFCRKCHGEIFSQWEKSSHNNAQNDPIYQKLYQLAEKETKGEAEQYCAASVCHTPIGHLAAEIPPIDGSGLSKIAQDGVQCDFCHTISDMEKVGDGSYISSPGNIKRGPYKDSKSPTHKTEFSRMHTEARFCGICHNVNHPVNGLALESTFTEWEEGPYNTGDPDTSTTCQDCHMTPGPGETYPNPGKASSIGPEREHVYVHYFAGANVALAKLTKSDKHQALAEERLKAAASIDIKGPESASRGETFTATVTVTNIGAGHKIPTGLTEMRQMWIEVVATDANGNYLFSSGFVDQNGRIDPGAVMYKTEVGDAKGKKTDHVWFGEKILSDNRISPGQSSTEEYKIKIPGDASGPLTLTSKLRYRSAPQSIVDELLGSETFVLPITDMASTSLQIQIP